MAPHGLVLHARSQLWQFFLGKVQLRELCFGCTTCCYLNLSTGHSMRQFFAIHFF